MRARRKTIDVEAMQWNGQTAEEVQVFCGPEYFIKSRILFCDKPVLVLDSQDSYEHIFHGDWLVKEGDRVERYSDESFRLAYEEVKE